MMIKFQLSTEGKIYRMFDLLREVPVTKKTSMLRILEQLKRNRRMLLKKKKRGRTTCAQHYFTTETD